MREKVLAGVELILSKSSAAIGILWEIASSAQYVHVSRKKKSTAMSDRSRYPSQGSGHSHQSNRSADQHNSTHWSPQGYYQGYGSPGTDGTYQRPYEPHADINAPFGVT